MPFEPINPNAGPEAPQVGLCVNLCEVAPPTASPYELEAMIADTCRQASFPHCERVYAGSYFCENYFCGLTDGFHESLREVCARHDMGATLVIPIIGQAFLERANRRIEEVLYRFEGLYDELAVNDVAAFFDLTEKLEMGPSGNARNVGDARQAQMPDAGEDASFQAASVRAGAHGSVRIGLGRLFTKNARDARIWRMMERVAVPELSPEAEECLQACGTRPIVELDPVADVVDASGVLAAAPNAEIALHLPFCYATTGRNCGPASIDEPVEHKFVIGRGCSRHCLRMAQGYLADEGARYVKHGRTFYFANPTCAIAGTPSWRIVYAAAHDTMSLAEALHETAGLA